MFLAGVDWSTSLNQFVPQRKVSTSFRLWSSGYGQALPAYLAPSEKLPPVNLSTGLAEMGPAQNHHLDIQMLHSLFWTTVPNSLSQIQNMSWPSHLGTKDFISIFEGVVSTSYKVSTACLFWKAHLYQTPSPLRHFPLQKIIYTFKQTKNCVSVAVGTARAA